MQPLAAGAKLAAYHARLRGSHDFQVFVDVLTLNEASTGTATFLDGQVNILDSGLVRRSATLTLSDPAGALDFADGSAWSGTHVWVDRLVRIRHVINVPGYGDVTAIPFVGPPTAIARSGAEVQVECQDKAALATRGARPYTAAKGANAVAAIRNIMAICTGEFKFRMPSSTRRLSKAYSVGWSDDAAPMVVASTIASAELGMQLLYSTDGYLMLRPLPESSVADIGYVTDLANASVDFTTISNFVVVSGGLVSKKVGKNTVVTRGTSTGTVPSGSPIDPSRIARNGVPRYLPLVIGEDAYKTTAQTAARARAETVKAARVVDDLTATVVPMFHLDADDVVTVHTSATAARTMRLHSGSIPLGITGDMTIGFVAWVSKAAAPRVASHITRVVNHPKPKPAKGKKRPHRHH